MRREIERIDKQLKRLVDAILEGADGKPINAKLKELDAEKERLTEVLSAAPDDKPLLHPNLAKVYRDRVKNLEALFRDSGRGREAFELIRGLIEGVRLVPAEGVLSIELKGELAAILALAQGAKRPFGSTQEALQIKVVAGRGFEPLTFRL